MLGADDSGYTQNVNAEAGTQPSWVIGFQDDRAALLTELQWVDPPPSDPRRCAAASRCRHQH